MKEVNINHNMVEHQMSITHSQIIRTFTGALKLPKTIMINLRKKRWAPRPTPTHIRALEKAIKLSQGLLIQQMDNSINQIIAFPMSLINLIQSKRAVHMNKMDQCNIPRMKLPKIIMDWITPWINSNLKETRIISIIAPH